MGAHVLIIDDEAGVRDALRMVLEYEGYEVAEAASGPEGLERVRAASPDLIFLDVKMPRMDGLEVLRRLGEDGVTAPVIVISGHGNIATAVEATKLGAFDFIEKPLGTDKILLACKNALRQRHLEEKVAELSGHNSTLVGESQAMQKVREAIRKAAPTQATILITGESGTGKELVALAIHRESRRSGREFIRVNCAAIPEELIESELFGHEKGAFTGAVQKQKGKFVQADSGTLFLDEIGDMSLRTQSKVLRALQDGEVEPVGSGRSLHVDVRVLAATNKDLMAEIQASRFREDLFHRLNVFPVRLPPLRERTDDIPALVRHFMSAWCRDNGRRPPDMTPAALQALRGGAWSGNVRELRNTIERLLILGEGQVVDAAQVEAVLAPSTAPPPPEESVRAVAPEATTLREFRNAAERAWLVGKLREYGWNVAATARAVGTPRSNLYKKLEAYGIRRETDGTP
ncbi:MAG: sigma-54-dependent Fis family transcriptional regulator [Acidobacteria bacterium]|nr:MAG: sigma-54-dependent Fis family transcriptional regulator [Acidobacteriota bacterium]